MNRYCSGCDGEVVWDDEVKEYACINCGYIDHEWYVR